MILKEKIKSGVRCVPSCWIDPITTWVLGRKSSIVFLPIKHKRVFHMKNIYKLVIAVSFLAVLSGCTGTVYNKDKTCAEDYLIHPVISIPAWIGACNSR